MDVLDIALVVLVVLAAIHGLRLGALVQVLTFGGFLLGLTLGGLLAVALARPVRSTTTRDVITLLLVLGLAVLLGVAGRILGSWGHLAIRRVHLGTLDGVLGVAVAAVAVLLSAWLVANVLTQGSYSWVSTQIQGSDVLRAIDDVLPPAPGVFAEVRGLLADPSFPSVFAGISPTTAPPVGLPSSSAAGAIAARAAGSTVKVLGQACGYLQEGSGFVVEPGLVVTNAHVVAGERSTQVVVGSGSYQATPVLYDPSFDLAVLRTDAPVGPPLTVDPDDVGRGTQGAVVGYPENGSLSVGPAGVAAALTAEGQDIYDQGTVVRKVYQIDADVQPGNSGGPLVAADGQVVGVVFSRSTVSAHVGYALASPGVLARVREAEGRSTPVGTGACTEG
ncbi:MAG: MarP family serine protease [Acidimicrobiales bacterium]